MTTLNFADMTYDELCKYITGRLVLAIGEGTFKERVYASVDLTLRWQKAQQEKSAHGDKMSRSIADMELTFRSGNILRNEGITTVGQLLTWSRISLNRIPNCGIKSVNEIEEVLATWGFALPVHGSEQNTCLCMRDGKEVSTYASYFGAKR